MDDLRFDTIVQRRVGSETRGMIHFQQSGLQILVYNDVKPKELEAHGITNIPGLTSTE